MHFCRRYGLWHKHHFLTENACFLRLDEGMTLQKTQLYCSGKVTTDQFWVPWYHRRSQGTNISILYHAPNYAPSIYDTTVVCTCFHSLFRSIKQIAYYDEWKNQRSPDILRLCHTCRVVRPLRAKHCRICDRLDKKQLYSIHLFFYSSYTLCLSFRCVAQFDHHCPYIYNCVGLRNRGWFLLFTLR